MKKKKRKIVLKSKSWKPLKKSDRAAYHELTALLNQFAVVVTDHFFRAATAKERATIVELVRAQMSDYYDDVDDGFGSRDCGPLCDINGDCKPCDNATTSTQ